MSNTLKIFTGLIFRILAFHLRKQVAKLVCHLHFGKGLVLCTWPGIQQLLMQQICTSVAGIDIDFQWLRYAKKKLRHNQQICTDATRLPIKPESFNSVLIAYVFHGMSFDNQKKILFEAERILKPGGVIIICDLDNTQYSGGLITLLLSQFIACMYGPDFKYHARYIKAGGLSTLMRYSTLQKTLSKYLFPFSRLIILQK